MTRGYKTGGRQAGTPNKMTAAKVKEIEESGLTPLEFMLAILRDEERPDAVRFEAAKAAAPYIHPRLASTELRGDPEAPLFPLQDERTVAFNRARAIAYILAKGVQAAETLTPGASSADAATAVCAPQTDSSKDT